MQGSHTNINISSNLPLSLFFSDRQSVLLNLVYFCMQIFIRTSTREAHLNVTVLPTGLKSFHPPMMIGWRCESLMNITKSEIRASKEGGGMWGGEKIKWNYQPADHQLATDQCANMLNGTRGALIKVMRNSIQLISK